MKFVRRNAKHFKSMEEFGRAIQQNWIEEFYDRLVDVPKQKKLPTMTEP